jgi:hypothetical protein
MRTLLGKQRRSPLNTSPEIGMNRETQIRAMLLLHLKQTERRGTLN